MDDICWAAPWSRRLLLYTSLQEKAINMHLQMVDVWWTLRPGYVM